MEPVKVIIRYSDGRLLKGTTNDFFPNKPRFHVRPIDGELSDKGTDVLITELKAVFFVKDFTGKAEYSERKKVAEGQHLSGRTVEVTFEDGEVLVGSTIGYDPKRPAFFITPVDPESNNLRVFVISAAVKNFRYL